MPFATADGWVVKLGLWPLRVAAQARVGIDLRAIVLSGDGRWLLAGNAAPRTAVLLDAELQPVKTLAAQTLDGQRDSRVAGVLDVAARRSFVVALQDIAELWEISYDPRRRRSTTAWCTTTRWARRSPGRATTTCAARRWTRRWALWPAAPTPPMWSARRRRRE
jgi:hypothetical protein